MALYCPHCGSELDPDSQFCGICGNYVKDRAAGQTSDGTGLSPGMAAEESPGTGLSAPVSPAKRSRKPLIIGAAAVAIVIVAVLIAVFALGPGQDKAGEQERTTATSEPAREDAGTRPDTGKDSADKDAAGKDDADKAGTGKDDAADKAATGKDEAAGNPEDDTRICRASRFSLALPSDIAARIDISEMQDGAFCMISADGIAIAEVAFPDSVPFEDELKARRYSLGDIGTCSFAYITPDGAHAAHWNDESATELSVSRLLGMTDLAFIDCLRFDGGGGQVAEPVLLSDDASSSGFSSSSDSAASAVPEPFWGIWIGASKDAGEAQAIADEAASRGLPAFVTTTQEWENLNSEPWYVISAGSYPTKDAAQAALGSVQSAGYADAYVKHSGNHV